MVIFHRKDGDSRVGMIGPIAPKVASAHLLLVITRWDEEAIERFAEAGEIEPAPSGAVLVTPTDPPQRAAVGPGALRFAREVRAAGGLPLGWRGALLAARRAAIGEVKAMTPEKLSAAEVSGADVDRAVDDLAADERLLDLERAVAAIVDVRARAAILPLMRRSFEVGVERGRAPTRRKVQRMAEERRSDLRPRVEELLLKGQTIGQVRIATGKRVSESTIKRIRRELRASGRLG